MQLLLMFIGSMAFIHSLTCICLLIEINVED
jgi:hypothetical protein